jgi:hypothetical protein
MSIEQEINRLIDLMPASGRMMTKIISKPQQSQVINAVFPLPWQRGNLAISINFDLWRRLSRPQRDLLLLRTVSSITNVKWFKPDIYQGVTLIGLIGLTMEITQVDVVGMIIAGGLTAIAANQIWRSNNSTQKEIEADEAALKVALRRGYTEVEAATHLLSAIETVSQIESRNGLNFVELIRSQNLRTIANLSSVGVPESVMKE